jgi:hypothetical protein
VCSSLRVYHTWIHRLVCLGAENANEIRFLHFSNDVSSVRQRCHGGGLVLRATEQEQEALKRIAEGGAAPWAPGHLWSKTPVGQRIIAELRRARRAGRVARVNPWARSSRRRRPRSPAARPGGGQLCTGCDERVPRRLRCPYGCGAKNCRACYCSGIGTEPLGACADDQACRARCRRLKRQGKL